MSTRIIKTICAMVLCSLAPCLIFCQIEICDNGIDDDGDSLIDFNDDDCVCELIEPVSLIPNPSFEEQNCCPTTRSQLNCATDWIQASEPTTDYIHNCDWQGWEDLPPPQPFPDGQGIMGFRDGRVRFGEPEPFWKEYAGACLLSPLRAGTKYRFQFDVGFIDGTISPAIDISFFGTTDCENLPFGVGDDEFGCPSNSSQWDKLSEVTVSSGGRNIWVNSTLEIEPVEDIYAIAIGPDCRAVEAAVNLYYYFDNLILDDLESFDLQISSFEHPCSPDYGLSVPFNESFEYQWYLDGIALVGEKGADLGQNYGEGSYQVRIMDGMSCRLTKVFEYSIPTFEVPATVVICEGETYAFGELILTEAGMFLDTFLNRENCDSIVALELQVIGQEHDTLDASFLRGEEFELAGVNYKEEGEYSVVFESSLGCDSLVLLRLEAFDIYIPNAFSPNFDGVNDFFVPSAPEGEVSSLNMQIFDRWGNKIYEGVEWGGGDAGPGVYLYRIEFQFPSGTSKILNGDLTLFR